jgi:uncharacterized protein (TIGR03032 family)
MATDPNQQTGTQAPVTKPDEPWLEVYSSRNFASWMQQQRISVAFTTYQSGKVFLLGAKPDGQLSVFERTFNRCMGLWANSDQTFWLSSLYQLWRFENALKPGEMYQAFDRLFIPRVGYTTGDIDVHDVAIESSGRVIFVNTKFNCLATLADRDSFSPIWRPPFVSKLAPEDRCHLNGLAMEDGKPRYMTAVSASDVVDGWRDRRRDGGVVMDIPSNRVIAQGLSMPHSPRVYRGKLWLLNSGTGQFGTIDRESGKFDPVCFCPGYLRGLAFTGDYAIMGLSRPRHDKTFGGLVLDETLSAKAAEARCGLHVIDLRTGDCIEWLRLEGQVTELYDVAVLPGVARPMALGFKTDEIERLLSVGPDAHLAT